MALSTPKVQNATPKERPYKPFDVEGLFLTVSPIGPGTPKAGKVWRLLAPGATTPGNRSP